VNALALGLSLRTTVVSIAEEGDTEYLTDENGVLILDENGLPIVVEQTNNGYVGESRRVTTQWLNGGSTTVVGETLIIEYISPSNGKRYTRGNIVQALQDFTYGGYNFTTGESFQVIDIINNRARIQHPNNPNNTLLLREGVKGTNWDLASTTIWSNHNQYLNNTESL